MAKESVRLLSSTVPEQQHIEVSVGESVRIMRELQELSQRELFALTGIRQGIISAIKNGRLDLSFERSEVLATALQCHPGVLSKLSHSPA